MTEQAPSKNYERELGGIQERMKSTDETLTDMQADIKIMQSDIKEMRDIVVGVKGGWKTISVIVAVSATIGAIAGKLTPLMAFFSAR
jgi:hypothetical protein